VPGHGRAGYIQASESGGEPLAGGGPGRQGARFEPGQMVERQPNDLLFGQRRAPGGTALGRPPGGGRKAAGLYARLLAAEPHATGRTQTGGRLSVSYCVPEINKAVAEMFPASKGMFGSPRITVSSRLFLSGVD
jgi:hypothetical protein